MLAGCIYMIERIRFEMYWNYYISIENMLRMTSQYVSPSKLNKKTYSSEFSKILLLACSEMDSILKLICKLNGIICNEKKYNMNVYAKAILKINMVRELSYAPQVYTAVNENALIVEPFKNLNKDKAYAGLEWWEDYQKIKHNRLENAECGNLYNAVSAVAAHFILLKSSIEFLGEDSGKEYVKVHSESNYFVPCI